MRGRKLSILGYTLSFLAGTVVSGGVALAATNYVQAMHHTSNMVLNGKTVSHPDALVYNNSTYVQLYSVEQTLKQLGITPGWDGTTFTMKSAPTASDTSNIAGISDGTTDNITVYADLGYSMVHVGVAGDRLATMSQSASDAAVSTIIENDIQIFNDNYNALSKDQPSDTSLQTMLTQYLAAIKELVPIYNQLDTAVKNNDMTLANQAVAEIPPVEQQLATIKQEFQDYTNAIVQSSDPTSNGSTSNTAG